MKQPISLLLELEEINMLACYASEEAVDTHETTLLRIGEIARNAAISLQKCEPMAQVEEGKYLVGFGRKETRKFVVFDQTLPVGTKLYTTPPSVEAMRIETLDNVVNLVERFISGDGLAEPFISDIVDAIRRMK